MKRSDKTQVTSEESSRREFVAAADNGVAKFYRAGYAIM